MIELLIVVSILGILTAVTLSVVSVAGQKKRAQDTILRGKLEQYTQAIESYGADVGIFPAASSGAPVGSPSLNELLGSWDAASGFTYVVNAGRTDFAVYVPVSNKSFYKYAYSWGKVKNCDKTSIGIVTICNDDLGFSHEVTLPIY